MPSELARQKTDPQHCVALRHQLRIRFYTLLWHLIAALQATGGSRLPLLWVCASTLVPIFLFADAKVLHSLHSYSLSKASVTECPTKTVTLVTLILQIQCEITYS